MGRFQGMGLAVGLLVLGSTAHAQSVGAAGKARAAGAAQEESDARTVRMAKGADADGEPGGEEETTEAADRAAAEATADEGEGTSAAPENYVVEPGDTLWDLCEKFLQNPWYWPKIWSYNPEIENAHWIYPGNTIRFYPANGEEVAAGETKEAAPTTAAEEAPEEASSDEPAEEGYEDQGENVDNASDRPPPPPPPDLFDAGDVAKKLAKVAKSGQSPYRLDGFVTKKELERSGEITGSKRDCMWFSRFDDIEIKLKSPAKQGDRFQIFRTTRELRHPVKPASLGFVVELLGVVEVEHADGSKAQARITESWGPIERGDRLGPVQDFSSQVAVRPNNKTLKGYVVEAREEYATQLGQHHVVFVDKGKGDGVQPGNTFEVLRNVDGWTDQDNLIDEVIGRVFVLDAKDGASTGLVTMSTTEILPGDRIRMQPQDSDAQ